MKKIKIVFIQHELVCGGAEQALFDLITLLDKERFEPMVFVQHPGGEWEAKFYKANIPIIYDYSCRVPTWNPIKKAGNVWKKIKIQKACQRECEGLLDICCPGADIVVSYSSKEGKEIGFAKNAKSIQYVHGNIATNQLYYEIITGKMAQLRKCDAIVCVADEAKRSFCEITGISDQVEMHYNPLNSENVRRLAERHVKLPTDVPIICGVGRLSSEKGFDRLIYIHRRLLDRGILHKLVLVGDGEDWKLLNRLIRVTETENSVILTGYQENPYPYMKQSRFLVNASYTEGLPVIAMEALCLGVPIVAPIPSVGEIFGDEPCGLITENNTSSLEAGIAQMLTDEAYYQRVKAGAERRSAFFDGKRMVREIEELFERLVSEN